MGALAPLCTLAAFCCVFLVLPGGTEAGTCPDMDLLVMMDDTGDYKPSWKRTMLLKDVVDILDVGTGATRMSLMNFRKTPDTFLHFKDTDQQNRDKIKDALDARVEVEKQKANQRGTQKAFQKAIDLFAKPQFGARSGKRDVAVLIVHGQSGNRGKYRRIKATEHAATLRANGVDLMIIGVGDKVDKVELNGFVDDNSKILYVDDYTVLTAMAPEVRDWLCGTEGASTQASLPRYTSSECKAADKIDVVALVPWFTEFRTGLFLQNLADTFNVNPTATQAFGMVACSTDARRYSRLDGAKTTLAVQNSLVDILYSATIKNMKRETRNTAAGLQYIREKMFCKNGGGRLDSGKAVLAIMDYQDSTMAALEAEANALKDLGIVIFAVAIGNRVTDAELTAVASSNAHKFRVDNPADLDSIVASMARSVCTQEYARSETATDCDAYDEHSVDYETPDMGDGGYTDDDDTSDDTTDDSSNDDDTTDDDNTDDGASDDNGTDDDGNTDDDATDDNGNGDGGSDGNGDDDDATGDDANGNDTCGDSGESAALKEMWCKVSKELKGTVFRDIPFDDWFAGDKLAGSLP